MKPDLRMRREIWGSANHHCQRPLRNQSWATRICEPYWVHLHVHCSVLDFFHFSCRTPKAAIENVDPSSHSKKFFRQSELGANKQHCLFDITVPVEPKDMYMRFPTTDGGVLHDANAWVSHTAHFHSTICMHLEGALTNTRASGPISAISFALLVELTRQGAS